MLEFAAHGFEERDLPGRLELAVYGGAEIEQELRAHFDDVSSERVEAGWEDRWRAFHRPVEIGALWVGPPWEEPRAELVGVVIDPGRAFGTGAHPTTRLCLELLQEVEPAGVLDVGCGSGVLSIAAAKLGFEPVLAIDNDPDAIEATLENARANGVSLEARLADGLADPLPKAGIVVANISCQVLEALAPRLRSPCLIASGFLATERPALVGYEVAKRLESGEWAAVLAQSAIQNVP